MHVVLVLVNIEAVRCRLPYSFNEAVHNTSVYMYVYGTQEEPCVKRERVLI